MIITTLCSSYYNTDWNCCMYSLTLHCYIEECYQQICLVTPILIFVWHCFVVQSHFCQELKQPANTRYNVAITYVWLTHHQFNIQVACIMVALLLHYFFLALFCWMLCEAAILYLFASGIQLNKKLFIFYLLGWGK